MSGDGVDGVTFEDMRGTGHEFLDAGRRQGDFHQVETDGASEVVHGAGRVDDLGGSIGEPASFSQRRIGGAEVAFSPFFADRRTHEIVDVPS